MANDQTLDTVGVVSSSRKKRIDSNKTTHIIGVRKSKTSGKYTSGIRNPITRKNIWLGTFGTAEEASRAYQSKKLEFQKLVKAKQQQYAYKHTHSKQDGKSEELVGVKQGYENVNCKLKSGGGSEINVPIANSSSVGTDQRTNSHEIAAAEEAFHDYHSKKKQVVGKEVFNLGLMANARGKGSSDDCNVATSFHPKAKRSFAGIKRQTNGRYAAVITDRVKHRKVWFGTFDTIEEASQAYLSKKSEFEKLSQQGKRENKQKKNCDQIQQPVVGSLSLANDQNLDTASVDRRREKTIGSHKTTTRIIGAHKRKRSGKYTSDIMNPITKKKIWLGTFDTAEEASHAYQSKKLQFQKLVNAKRQQQDANKQTHSKQVGKSEKLANVKQRHENQNCELNSVGGSGINVPISNSYSGETDQRINSHKIGSTEEAFQAYLFKKFDSHSLKEVELQSNMSTDSSSGKKKQEGQEDDKDLWLGQWIQLPGNREVMFSLKLGLPIIDNYGSLLGEFSSLDDLSIC